MSGLTLDGYTTGKDLHLGINSLVYEAVLKFGGSISAEHGVGSLKADTLHLYKDPVALQLMRSIKQALDPQNLMNPGRVLAKKNPPTAGRIISDTMRRAIQNGLAQPQSLTSTLHVAEPQAVYGFAPLTPSGQHIVTPDMVRALRDELGE